MRDLPPGEPLHPQAGTGEGRLALAVALEPVVCGVGGEAVGLDDEAVVAPEEVDLQSCHPRVGLGARDSRTVDEREEASLQGAPRHLPSPDRRSQRGRSRPPCVVIHEGEEGVPPDEPLRLSLPDARSRSRRAVVAARSRRVRGMVVTRIPWWVVVSGGWRER